MFVIDVAAVSTAVVVDVGVGVGAIAVGIAVDAVTIDSVVGLVVNVIDVDTGSVVDVAVIIIAADIVFCCFDSPVIQSIAAGTTTAGTTTAGAGDAELAQVDSVKISLGVVSRRPLEHRCSSAKRLSLDMSGVSWRPPNKPSFRLCAEFQDSEPLSLSLSS